MGFDFAKVRSAFFDSPAVLAKVAAGKRRGLSKFGAFVRRRSRSSIRKRKASSPPGQPPSSHAGQLRLIFFAWDQSAESVVVGPVSTEGGGRAPQLLEFGGTATRRRRDGRSRQLHYAGNPFMAPALDAELPKFASQFKGMLHG